MNLKKITFNRAQLNYMMNLALLCTNIWSRASGKSFIIAWLMHLCIRLMPRGTFVIHGSTFVDILNNTLPETLAAMQRLGYVEGVHYLIGKKPPASWTWWQKPRRPVLDPERCLFFMNGTVFLLSSQDRTKRGASVDGIIIDEGLNIKIEKLEQDLLPTNRGKVDAFQKVGLHHFLHIFSSMPHNPEGNWLLEVGGYYQDLEVDYRSLKSLLIKKEIEFIDSNDRNERKFLWGEIQEIKKQLKYFVHVAEDGIKTFYQEADCLDNILNIGLKYIKQQRASMTDLNFMIEMLNMIVSKIEGGFYHNLDLDTHTYTDALNFSYVDGLGFDFKKLENRDSRWDADCNPNKKLEISVDWGGHFNCMCVHQSSPVMENVIKRFYVKPPKILDHLVEEFCEYYRFHQRKEIDFYYDRNGNSKNANSELTFAQQAAMIMKSKGWTVNMKSNGLDPPHKLKFLLINLILSEKRSDFPTWRCNYKNAGDVANSMLMAPVIDRNGEIKKDKSSERKIKSVKQEKATHFSDAEDIYLYGKYGRLIDDSLSSIGMMGSR